MDYRLREPLHILKSIREDDGFGGIKITWQRGKIIWGSIKFIAHHKIVMNSHSLVKQGLIFKENLIFQIVVRDPSGLGVSDRLEWKNKTVCVVSDPVPTRRLGYVQVYGCVLA